MGATSCSNRPYHARSTTDLDASSLENAPRPELPFFDQHLYSFLFGGEAPIFTYPRFALATLSTVPFALVFLVVLWLYSYATVPALPVKYEGGNLIVYDPEIGFVAKPESHVRWLSRVGLQDFDVFTDARSGRTDQIEKARDKADVLIIGCSQSWGPFLQYQQTYAAKLGPNVENLAMASYGTVQSLQMLKRNLDLTPKLVIYGFISDHLRRNVMPCAPSYYPFCLDVSHIAFDPLSIQLPWSDGVSRLNQHLVGPGMANWVPHGIDVAIARYRKAWADSHIPSLEDQGRALAFLLAEMARTARSAGAHFVVLYIPGRDEPGPPEGLKQAVATLAIPLIDPSSAFEEHKRKGKDLYVPDGHLSETGHAVITEVLQPLVRSLTPE